MSPPAPFLLTSHTHTHQNSFLSSEIERLKAGELDDKLSEVASYPIPARFKRVLALPGLGLPPPPALSETEEEEDGDEEEDEEEGEDESGVVGSDGGSGGDEDGSDGDGSDEEEEEEEEPRRGRRQRRPSAKVCLGLGFSVGV